MNGLGLSVSRATGAGFVSEITPPPASPLPYITDDYFASYNVEGGQLSFTENQTVDGVANWLKVKFPKTNQTDISGISKRDAVRAHELQSGFSYKIQFSIELEDASKWTQGADNTEVTMKVSFGGVQTSYELTPDTVESIDTGVQTANQNNANDLTIFFDTTNDLPESEAVFYIKSLTIQAAQKASSIT